MGASASQAVVLSDSDGLVYVFGGVADMSYIANDDAYSYDPYTGDWTVLSPMAGATRGAAGAVGLDGLMYVFGGTVGPVTQIYDPVADSWSLGAAMPGDVWEAKAATVGNGSIWVVGGEGAPASGYVQIYDPAADSWSVGPAAPADVQCGALVSVGDDLYYSGGGVSGYTGTTQFFKYDAALGSWGSLADLPEPLAGHAMVVGVDGLLYTVGGADNGYNDPGSSYTDAVISYDPEADEWTYATSMDSGRTYLGATVIPDGRIIALGGNTDLAVLSTVESLQLYLFEYSMALSSTSVRAGESVLLTLDAEFTYIEEYYAETYVLLVSDADGAFYSSQYMWNPTDGPMAVVIDIPSVAPAGAYTIVVDYYMVYSDNAYEQVNDEELALEVLPAAVPTDELIADLEAQLADLQAQLDALNETDAALMDEIAALQDQIEDLQASQDETNQDVTDVQTSVDDKLSAMMGYAIIGLLVVVVVLLIVMMVMGRKSAPPAP